MTERTTGPWALLEWPALYTGFQRLVAGRDTRSEIVDQYIRPRPLDRVLDIGCGPADLLPYLGPVKYFGIDHNPKYIEQARARWGDQGEFICGDAGSASGLTPGTFDLVLATGVLHHLRDDQAKELFSAAHRLLRPGGRLVTTDPAFTDNQNPIARLIIRNDRGASVRHIRHLEELASGVFPGAILHVRTDLMRIPYTHAILECPKV